MTTAAVVEVRDWPRRRLLAVLAGIVAGGLVLLGGLGYAVYLAAGRSTSGTGDPARNQLPDTPLPGHGDSRRDAIAAAPMLQVAPDDGRQGTPAATPGPSIDIPAAVSAGPAQVPTGFPKTPDGAIGQLAAIESTVLDAMSIAQANAVYGAWALPGGVGAASWELTADVQAFLGSTGGQAAATGASVVATPEAAQVKGVDGDGWVLACVLMDVRAVLVTDSRIGYGYCEWMQWVGGAGGRWMIAPGTPPSRAPSTWPGTQLSIQAGWRTWTVAGGE